MTIFGKTYGEYLRFQGWFLFILAVVGIARLALSMGGVPTSVDKFVSLTIVALIGLVAFPFLVHRSGFGSYKQLLVIYWNNAVLANLIVIIGILMAMRTGHDNIYTLPEYSRGMNGKTPLHIVGHLVAGVIIGPLLAWGIGSLILLIIRKMTKPSPAS